MAYTTTLGTTNLDNLTGVTTINVSGRGTMGRNLTVIDIPGKDGSFILSQKLPPRYIEVFYLLKADKNEDFQTRLNALHDALSSSGDVKVSFSDEAYHRMGRVSEANDPPYDQLQGVGSFVILCADPYKYKAITTLAGASVTAPAGQKYPYKLDSIELTFTENRTGFTISNATTGRKIILTGSFTTGQALKVTEEEITLNGQSIKNRLDFINSDWREFQIYSGNVVSSTETMTVKLLERAL